MAATYTGMLDQFSAAVVEAACKAIIRRGDQFVPSAGAIFAMCETQLAQHPGLRPPKAQAPRIAAPATSPADQERMKAGFAKILEELRASSDPPVKREGKPMSEITKPEAEAALERMLVDLQPLPQLSERLRATIKPATKTIETEEDLTQCLR